MRTKVIGMLEELNGDKKFIHKQSDNGNYLAADSASTKITKTRSPVLGTYSCHGIFTDRSIFSLNLTGIQTPAGPSVTNHKHGLNFMYFVFYYVDICAREAAIVLPYRCALMQTGAELFNFARKEAQK